MCTLFLRSMTVIALALFAATGWAQQPVGRFQLATGEVQVIGSDKKARPGARGDVVHEGDTIVTGKGGAAHIRMSDEGIIAMRADTTIVIDTYRWEGKEDGTERSVLSLVKGGFRAITGVIGRTNKSQYLINTTTATIGIRGTDHEPYFIPPPAAGETPPGDPGTYNKVNIGETFIRSAAGTVELGPNQVGFASVLPDVTPVRLERMPEFLRSAALPRGKPDLRGVREFASRAERRAEVARTLQERNVTLQQYRQLLIYRKRTAGEDFDLAGQQGRLDPAPRGVALTGSIVFRDDGNLRGQTGGIVVGSGTDSILLNAANEPVIISDQSGFRYSREGAPIVDRGSAVVDGTGVKWGVYTGGLRFDESRGASRTLLFTFMMAGAVTPPALLQNGGGAIYNQTAGFTLPVDDNRRIGGVADLDAAVAFGTNPRILRYNLRVRDASARTWNARLNGPQSLQSFSRAPSSPNLTVNCTGTCAPTGQGAASGFVIGPNRGGLISSYGLVAGQASVTGSIVVVKP